MELKVTLEGGKRVAARIGEHLVMTDQPSGQGGGGSAPSPYDLFMASIGTCVGFFVQSYCESKGIDSSGIEITLRAEKDSEHKRVTGFVTTLHLPPEIPRKLHAVLEKVAGQCTVKKTIMAHPDFVVETVAREQ